MTKQEFVKNFIKNSTLSEKEILERMDAYPCECGNKDCSGWQMLTPMGAKIAKKLGHIKDG